MQAALQELKELRLVRFVLPSHGKSVIRYRHVLDEAYGLDAARVALLAVLLLRGPQTPGELRARTARLAEFDSLEALQGELQILSEQPEPLIRLLPRQPGQKEDRWQQLLAAEVGPAARPGAIGASADDAAGVHSENRSAGGSVGPGDLEERIGRAGRRGGRPPGRALRRGRVPRRPAGEPGRVAPGIRRSAGGPGAQQVADRTAEHVRRARPRGRRRRRCR